MARSMLAADAPLDMRAVRARGPARARALGLFGAEDPPEVEAAKRLLGDDDWTIQRDLDALTIAFPTTLEIDIRDPVDNFFSLDDRSRIGILWDDRIVAAGPIVVVEGSVVQVPLNARLGQRLRFFAIDPVVGEVRALSPADAVKSATARKEDEARGVFDKLFDSIEEERKTLSFVGVVGTVLVVGGLFYLLSQIIKQTDTTTVLGTALNRGL